MLFIDASKLFVKEKKQNVMTDEHIDKVVELYRNRQSVDKVATLASFEEIKANDFNLNIPRYIDTSEPEPEIDLKALSASIRDTDTNIKKGTNELLSIMNSFTFNKQETEEAVNEFIKVLQEG